MPYQQEGVCLYLAVAPLHFQKPYFFQFKNLKYGISKNDDKKKIVKKQERSIESGVE